MTRSAPSPYLTTVYKRSHEDLAAALNPSFAARISKSENVLIGRFGYGILLQSNSTIVRFKLHERIVHPRKETVQVQTRDDLARLLLCLWGSVFTPKAQTATESVSATAGQVFMGPRSNTFNAHTGLPITDRDLMSCVKDIVERDP